MSKKASEKTVQTKKKFVVYKYTVILFYDAEVHQKLFECIPDNWFVDELRESCFFPPKTGKSYIQRAINCEKPQDNWGIYECKVVREGFSTYNAGFKLVKEKCAQRYNTSSADEEIEAAKYRRKHPALFGNSIEHIFLTPTTTEIASVREPDKQVEETATTQHEIMDDLVVESANVIDSNSGNALHGVNNAEISKRRVDGNEKNEIPSKPRKTEHLKQSVQSSGYRRSRSRSSQRRSSISVNQQSRISPARHRSRSKDSMSSHRRNSNSGCQKPENLCSPTNLVLTSRSSYHKRGPHSSSQYHDNIRSRSNSNTSSQPSRGSHTRSRSTSRRPRNSRSHSKSVQSVSSSHGRSTRSRTTSRRSRSSRSHSKSVQSINSIRGRSTRLRSTGRRQMNSRSHSKSVQSINSSHGRSARSRSTGRRQRNSRSHSKSVQSSNSIYGRSSRSSSISKRQKNSRRHSNFQLTHSGHRQYNPRSRSSSSSHSRLCLQRSISHRHSELVRSGLGHSQPKRNVNIDFNASRRRDHQSIQKNLNVNGKTSKSSVSNAEGDLARHISASSHQSTDNHHLSSRSQFKPRNSHSPVTASSVKQLIANVNELSRAVKRNNDLLAKNDRRLTRLEVTVNKIFITVGDMNGNNRFQDENDINPVVKFPDLPIERKSELYKIHSKLKDKEFRKFWLDHERNFCCPTKTSTDTVTITKYLKRFITLKVRCQLTLKEPGESGLTLYKDFHRVYLFLVDVMKEGYRICGKKITVDEAHTALRVVWGRSKQLRSNVDKK